MNDTERKSLYTALAAPFPEEAVERTNGKVTGRGYDTTGIKYQFIVNRLNEVLGLGGWRSHRNVTVTAITTSSGRKAYEAICDLILQLGVWANGEFQVFAEALADGGHISVSEADARKGSFTNALKKGAAMFGCGRQAYEGTLDDDNAPTIEPTPDRASTGVTPLSHRATTGLPPGSNPGATAVQERCEPSGNPGAHPGMAGGITAGGEQHDRSRLTAKQLAALWAISKQRGMAPPEFRKTVKEQHGVQPEFLTRVQASGLIGSMGNGHAGQGA